MGGFGEWTVSNRLRMNETEIRSLLASLIVVLITVGCSSPETNTATVPAGPATQTERPNLPFDPNSYIVYRATGPIEIDGELDEVAWANAPWSTPFVERDPRDRPHPEWETLMKMLWDDEKLYVAAYIEDHAIWGEATERNSQIHPENAFEIFLDPDGDTHNYLEFQVNALGTMWDLFITKPRGNGRLSTSTWNMIHFEHAISTDGEVNNPEGEDRSWTVELAYDWDEIRPLLGGRDLPVDGDQWRVAFMRIVWDLVWEDGRYRKEIDPETGQPWPEYKYVWSPQVRSQHIPETWGYLQFSEREAGSGTDTFDWHRDEEVKWVLRLFHYAQLEYYQEHGRYAQDASDLEMDDYEIDGYEAEPLIETTRTLYEATLPGFDSGTQWHIRQDGLVWKSESS